MKSLIENAEIFFILAFTPKIDLLTPGNRFLLFLIIERAFGTRSRHASEVWNSTRWPKRILFRLHH
jgi:hypothetical protein